METTSINRLNLLHPKIRLAALAAYDEAVKKTPVGVHPFINQTLRTFEESDHLYQLGRTIVNPDGKSKTKPLGNIVTNAPGGRSFHNYGLAFDFVNQINGEPVWTVNQNWMLVVSIFKAHGFTWGGDFNSIKDYPHFEMTFGHKWQDLLELYNNKVFIPGTNYVKI